MLRSNILKRRIKKKKIRAIVVVYDDGRTETVVVDFDVRIGVGR